MNSLSESRHKIFHSPIINGESVKPIPYLTLPFRKSEVKSYNITEGWVYSRNEKAVHGFKVHGGVDYHVAYGTPVVAPCDGLAISSYHSFPLLNEDESPKTLEGKKLYFGLGYFVQIYNPEVNRFIQLGHLSDISNNIPFSLPVFSEDTWTPTNHILKISELKNNSMVAKLHRGDLVGYVGYSGLRWGYDDYVEGSKRPVVLDFKKYKSFDESHVHFEDFFRDQETGKKGWQRDPYDVYLSWSNYPTPKRKRSMGKEPLFYLDENGLPLPV